MDEPSANRPELLRQQEILAQFGELALRSDDLGHILTEACQMVGQALNTDFAKVVELQPDGRTLIVRAGVGWKPGVVGIATIEAAENTSEGYALKTGEPMISPNIDEETRFHYAPFLIENGAKAVANVIIIGGKDRPPFGILQVDSRKPREFTDADVSFLRTYANLLAAAVDRLRVLNESRDIATRLRLALEAGELGSFEVDRASGLMTRSKRFDQILDNVDGEAAWSVESTLEKIVPDDRAMFQSTLAASFERQDLWKIECRVQRPDSDEVRWVEFRGRPQDDASPSARLVGIVSDVTARKEAEAALNAQNASLETQVSERTISLGETNSQLDAFAYTVSHDLRAPLRAMEGFARILLDDFASGLGDEGVRFATRIVGAAKRMEVLIDDLLAFSRVQRADVVLQAVDPGRAIAAAVSELQAAGADAASFDIANNFPPILADRAIFRQTIANLIGNSVKFARRDIPAHVAVRWERIAGRIRITVEDNGIGIASEHQQRIFNVFERLHGQETYPGTGVGLAIVKAGAERMNGTFGVTSELGSGSRFWVEFKAASAA